MHLRHKEDSRHRRAKRDRTFSRNVGERKDAEADEHAEREERQDESNGDGADQEQHG